MKITTNKLPTVIFASAIAVFITSDIASDRPWAQDLSKTRSQLPAKNTNTKDQISPEVRFVAAGIRQSRENIKCGQATMTIYTQTVNNGSGAELNVPKSPPTDLKEIPRGFDQVVSSRWYYQGSSRAQVIQHTPPSGKILSLEHIVLSPTEVRTLQHYITDAGPHAGVSYYTGVIEQSKDLLHNDLLKNYERFDPRYYAYFLSKSPLDKFITKTTGITFNDDMPAPIYKGETSTGGSRCAIIEASSPREEDKYIFWIDTDHSFIVRQMEAYVRLNGKMVLENEIKVPEIIESNGVWMPATIIHKTYLNLSNNETKPTKDRPFRLKQINISEFSVNCDMPTNSFNLRWPLGANIVDATDDFNLRELIVIAREKQYVATLNQQRKAQSKTELATTIIEGEELADLNKFRRQNGLQELKEPVSIIMEQHEIEELKKSEGAKTG